MAYPNGRLVTPTGFNPSGVPRALELDANDYLKVAIAAWLEGAVDVKGWTGAAWTPLLVNASGQAIAVGKGTSEEVNAALLTPARALVGGHGYISGAWQKNPLSFGYSGQVAQQVANNDAPAGDNQLNGTAVPAGEIWVITFMSGFDIETNPTSVDLYAIIGGTGMPIAVQKLPGANVPFGIVCNIVLKQGDYAQCIMRGCALHNHIYFSYGGYKVAINL
jgi:hypothetical protein